MSVVEFEANAGEVLKLVTNALYTDEPVVRELISNAADALEKASYLIKKGDIKESDTQDEPRINIIIDREAGTLTFQDNGIGMNAADMKENLGTIARSGTKAFLEKMKLGKADQNNLIGQFGVGFYVSFIVADKVTVRSRKLGEPANKACEWISDGAESYELKSITQETPGTSVILHLKADKQQYLESWKIEHLVKETSDYLAYDIMLTVIESEEDKKKAQAQAKAAEDNKEMEAPKAEPIEDKIINQGKALWLRPKKDIKDAQYEEFYEHVAGFGKPLAWTHNRVEGKLEYTMLLYIPEQAPFDLYHKERKNGLKLYVQRVFIMEEVNQFLPNYLRFMKGIIDSSDLPLNVSREILQKSAAVETIRSACVKKTITLLKKLAENDTDKYKAFWKQFGQVLKEGMGEDFANRDALAELLRFNSTQSDAMDPGVSLQAYVDRMQKDQEFIYYVTADGLKTAKSSPHLEYFAKKGIEVLLLHERVDEWMVAHLTEFSGKKLKSIARAEIDSSALSKEEKAQQEDVEKDLSDVLKRIEKALEKEVKSVKLSHRLTDSPACLVADENDLSGNLKRMLKEAGQAVPDSKPILELNGQHPLVKQLRDEQSEDKFASWSRLLFNQAVLAEGGQVDNPAEYVKSVNALFEDLLA